MTLCTAKANSAAFYCTYQRRIDEDDVRFLCKKFHPFGAMDLRPDLYGGLKSKNPVKWHSFKDAIVEGGVFEGEFMWGRPQGWGTCTFYVWF